MSASTGIGMVIPLVERGLVPQSLIRWGIRRLHKERLEQESRRHSGNAERVVQAFVDQLCQSPVALTPEAANEQHYEVPAPFFERVLGKHLKYSGCYWPEGVDSLDEAEAAMLSLTCERAEISDGQKILELGCGWGSLALWMAERYPRSNITAISNSHSQRKFIESRCADRGLDNLRVKTVDMNDFSIDEPFDRVVSVEMFEHMRNYETLLQRIAGWLKPEGKLFVHVFCHVKYPYLFETSEPADWMGRHFFTSGMMPSADLLPAFQRDLTLDAQWFMNGRHYARTAEAWYENQRAHRSQLRPLLRQVYGEDAEKWFTRWQLFFLACAELFNYADGNEWGVGHYRFRRRD